MSEELQQQKQQEEENVARWWKKNRGSKKGSPRRSKKFVPRPVHRDKEDDESRRDEVAVEASVRDWTIPWPSDSKRKDVEDG